MTRTKSPLLPDSDDASVYPEEKLYAEEFKRGVFKLRRTWLVSNIRLLDTDDAFVYPEEKLYAEEF